MIIYNRNTLTGCIIALLLGLFTFFSCDSKEENGAPVKVELTGHFTTVGNAPFIRLVFRTDSGESYEVDAAEAEKFSNMQGSKMTIEAMASTLYMETADGKIKRKFYRIKQIKVTGTPK